MSYMKEQWIDTMTKNMKMKYPNLDDEKIRKIVSKSFSERFTDHEAVMYNNYDEVYSNVTLNGILDWIQTENPLICESGCFFKQKNVQENIIADIIEHDMLDERAKIKKRMFELLKNGDEIGASFSDLRQANVKKATNAVYGSEGESSSFFYNLHCAMSTTSCGRGQLSTATQALDNLMADMVKFMNMNEFYYYINNIIEEKPSWKFNTFDYIDEVPSKRKFVKRFLDKFYDKEDADVYAIESIYEKCDDDMRCRLYYKSRIYEFISQTNILKLFTSVAYTDCDYIDPNECPDELKDTVDHIVELFLEFVNYKYQFFRYEDRTRHHRRAAIVAMDTDSCFIYYGNMLKYVIDRLPPLMLRKKKPSEDEVKRYKKIDKAIMFRVMNTLANITDAGCHQALYHYTDRVGIPVEDRWHIRMKNEFYLSRLVTTFAKKSYVGMQERRESTVFDEPVIDVKGLNFFKSTASKNTTKFIYDEILMKQIFKPKDGKLNTARLHRSIMKYQDKIAKDIKNGDIEYLKRSIRVKSADGYKDPMRIYQYKAVMVWNMLNPDNQISLPATVTIVKVNLLKKEAIAVLDKYSEIYARMEYIFDNYASIFPVPKSQLDSGKIDKKITTIALPGDMDVIPDWILDIIDVETIISDNMKLFVQLYKPLGLIEGHTTHAGSSVNYYTNIIRI